MQRHTTGHPDGMPCCYRGSLWLSHPMVERPTRCLPPFDGGSRRAARVSVEASSAFANRQGLLMPPRKSAKPNPGRSLEQTLWEAADKMRGNLEAAEYKHVALGLVFLKYVSDAFEQRRVFLASA